jgi:hypothetical protein
MKPNKTKNTDQQPQNINNNTDLMKYATVTLGSGNLKQAVILPEGEDLNEWIAANSNKSFLSLIN